MKNEIDICLTETVWQKLIKISSKTGVSIKKQAEVSIVFKLFEDIPPIDKKEFVLETKSIPGILPSLFSGMMKKIVNNFKVNSDSENIEKDSQDAFNEHLGCYELKLFVSKNHYNKLRALAEENRSTISFEASRLLTNYMMEKY